MQLQLALRKGDSNPLFSDHFKHPDRTFKIQFLRTTHGLFQRDLRDHSRHQRSDSMIIQFFAAFTQ